jgi:probable rRNA maturation factor
MPWIRRVATAAVPLCAESARPGSAFEHLDDIEATIISDSQIAKIHGQFFNDPTPTDVITFDHGEILLGADTIANHAMDFSMTPSAEAALCVIHGMLHLGGWNDLTPPEARSMAKQQENILRSVAFD